MQLKLKIFFTLFIYFIFSLDALAYIGPGMAGGMVVATIGIVIAILAAIFGILWFPIRRLIKKRKKNKTDDVKKSD